MALSIIDCVLMPFPTEISAKILYLAGAMDFEFNARKYLQLKPRKIKNIKSTYSDIQKLYKKKSGFISERDYSYSSRKKSKITNNYIYFHVYSTYSQTLENTIHMRYEFSCKGRTKNYVYKN